MTMNMKLYSVNYLDSIGIKNYSNDQTLPGLDDSDVAYAVFYDSEGSTPLIAQQFNYISSVWTMNEGDFGVGYFAATDTDGTSEGNEATLTSIDVNSSIATVSGDMSGDDGSNMSGTFEIFSSFDLSYYIDVTFADSTPLITSGKFYSISPTDSGFDLQEWKQENGQWKTEGSPVAGYAPYADEAAMTAAFQSNSVTPEATVNMNTDMPANLYTMADLISVGIQPISNTASYGDDINTGYAVFTDQSGTTTILRYLKDGDGNFNLNETAPNPLFANGSQSLANSIPHDNVVGTGDVPNPFPVGAYTKSDVVDLFAEITSDTSVSYFAVSESYNNKFMLQPLKLESGELVVDGSSITTATDFNPSVLGNAFPSYSWTQTQGGDNSNANDGSNAHDGSNANDGANANANQDSIFGKVYQIDTSNLDTILGSGHTFSSGMQYTFEMNDQNQLIISKVMMESSSTQKYLPYGGDPSYSTYPLASAYNSVQTLSTYIEGITSGFEEVGSMLKRVDGTDPNSAINLHDSDFEGTYDASSELMVKHADKNAWPGKHVYSIDADAFKTGVPDVDGFWVVEYNESQREATYTKVISDNGGYVPDPGHTPLFFTAVKSIETDIQDDGTAGRNYDLGDLSGRLAGNNMYTNINNAINSYEGQHSGILPPVSDTGSTLSDGITPIYKDESSGSEDLLIKIGDDFVSVRSNGEAFSTSSGTKNLSALETAPISSLEISTNDWNYTSLSDVFEKMSGVVQPIDKLSVDIVIPLSDVFDYGDGYDNRTTSGTQINSLAFVPAGDKFYIFDDIYVSFENNFDGDLDKVSFKLTNARYYTEGGSYLHESNQDYYYNLVGNFEDLSNGGSLDLYMASAWSDSNSDGMYNIGEEIYNPELGSTTVDGVSVPQAASVGTSVISAGGQIILPGGTNGYTAGAGDDYIMMNVSAISSYSGEFIGGDGWDYLDIKNDTGGMIVDFLGGNQGDPNSAFVTWSEGGNTGFVMSDFEAMFLSHGNDVAMIGADVGENLTDKFDANHFIGSQSMFRLETGNADWDSVNNTLGTDYLYVNSDSNIYLSFNFAYDGVTATFNEDVSTSKQSAVISNTNINTYVDEIDGTGQLVDAIKTTGYNDMVINNGSTGITVDLGGTNYEYEHTAESDIFIGSASSNYDILDAREAFDFTFDQTTINNPDTSQNIEGVKVSGNSEIGNVIDADLANVDYIMVRDASEDLGSITDDDEIWNSMATADVDFYKDMSDIYGQYQIEGLGSLTSDSYGQGYDVQTSASVENFGGETKRIYYDGNHSDFIDTTDRFAGEEGVYSMQLDTSGLDSTVDPYAIGSNWAKEVEESNPNGGEGSFYIVVGGKKVAVAHDGNGWKVDNTALFIAENASASITGPTNISTFTQDVADRYNIQYDGSDGTITNDIYLNATEQQIDEVLASPNGLVSSAQAFNFGFYTQFQIGETTLNIKLQQDTPPSEDVIAVNSLLGSVTGNIVVRGQEGSYELYYVTGDGTTTPFVVDGSPIAQNTSAIVPQNIIDWTAAGFQGQVHYPAKFSVNENDIDLMVESVFNRVETDGAGVSSGGEVGNFVKVDNVSDIALGNGGNDTYVIESSTMGTALEYGDINETVGGLDNSDADSVNFSGIATAAELNFSRGSIKNESTDSTLIISDGTGSSTFLFDNYNTYFDFRRVEYLTVDDAANNDEIFEISVDGNIGNDGTNKDLEWDNEIVVAKSSGDTIYADGGTDILVGGDGVDEFNLENVVGGTDHNTMSHVHIKNFSEGDSIVMESTDTYTDTEDNGIITVDKSDGSQYMIFTDDETMLKTYIDTALGIA